jgi:hypothetical protein
MQNGYGNVIMAGHYQADRYTLQAWYDGMYKNRPLIDELIAGLLMRPAE